MEPRDSSMRNLATLEDEGSLSLHSSKPGPP